MPQAGRQGLHDTTVLLAKVTRMNANIFTVIATCHYKYNLMSVISPNSGCFHEDDDDYLTAMRWALLFL